MKYKVMWGDIFGGFATGGEDLTFDEAKKLQNEIDADCDYFTSTYLEDENGKKIG